MTDKVDAPGRRRLEPPPPPPAMAPPEPEWLGGVELDVGDHRVGVRTDSVAVLDLVRETFDQWIVGDLATGGDFGISVERRGGAGPRLVPQLLHGRSSLLRSRSLPRLLRRLDVGLGTIAAPPGGPEVHMAAFVRGQRAVLVPTSVAERSTGVERAVAAAGATIAEQASLRIDLAMRELVVVPGLTHPRRVPELVDGLATPPGRYTLQSICWSADQLVGDERTATSIARLAEHIDLRDVEDRQLTLEQVVALRDCFAASAIPRWGTDMSIALNILDGSWDGESQPEHARRGVT